MYVGVPTASFWPEIDEPAVPEQPAVPEPEPPAPPEVAPEAEAGGYDNLPSL